MDALERYSEIITPWATKVAENFTADIARQNEKQWRQHSRNISAELRNMVDCAPVGQVMKSIVAEQIKYIKSLPLEAADRVYDIQNKAIEAVVTGGRAESFAKEIKAVMLWRKTLPRTGSLVRTRKYPLAKPQTRVTR